MRYVFPFFFLFLLSFVLYLLFFYSFVLDFFLSQSQTTEYNELASLLWTPPNVALPLLYHRDIGTFSLLTLGIFPVIYFFLAVLSSGYVLSLPPFFFIFFWILNLHYLRLSVAGGLFIPMMLVGTFDYTFHNIHHLLFIHYSLFIIHYSLFIIHYSLFIIHYSLFIIHYSLFIIHYFSQARLSDDL